LIQNIEKVLLEFYGFNLLEFAFYVVDGFVGLSVIVVIVVVTFRHFRKTGSTHTKLMFFSFIGLLLSSIIASLVME
jgi:hypothetical protein